MQPIEASYIFHRNEQRIRLQFDNHGLLNKLIKSIAGARWSKTYKSWHIPRNKILYNSFKRKLPDGCVLTEIKKAATARPLQTKASPPVATKNNKVKSEPANRKIAADTKIVPSALNLENQHALQQYLQCLQLKAYSASTIKTYRNEFLQLLQILKSKNVKYAYCK